MTDTSHQGSPPSLFGPRANRTVFRPSPHKPACDAEWDANILNVIQQMQQKVPQTQLSGWVYYDNFLRFLYLIGAQNAALIPDLHFSGMVKLHECTRNTCGSKCEDDLVHSLELYGYFMAFFCKGMKKLTVEVLRDRRGAQPRVGDDGVVVGPTADAMLPFLRERLPLIQGLRTLVILENGQPVSWTREIEEWFEKREKERGEREQVAKEEEREARVVVTMSKKSGDE